MICYNSDPLLDQPNLSGSTCIVLFVHQRSFLTVANLGDSRAVLCRSGTAVQLSEDHKPNLPKERARIERAGGLNSRMRNVFERCEQEFVEYEQGCKRCEEMRLLR
jgi:serine/threonine protein phosphatase PrpC